MIQHKRQSFFTMLLLACLGSVQQLNAAVALDHAVMKSFAEHVSQLGSVEASAKQQAQRTLDDQAIDPADRLTEALGRLYPDYADALSAADRGSPADTINRLTPLVKTEDLFLSADASFFLGRTLMNEEQFETALPLLKRLSSELSGYSIHRDVISYYTGIAQAGLLKNKEAAATLTGFLEEFPDAPERLRVSAWRKVQELETIEAGKLDDVYQRMDYSRRRLEHIKTDEATQEQQEKIVKLLSQLIKEEEKKEASSSKSNTKKQQKSQKNQQAQSQPKQSSSSQSSKAGSSNNANGRVVDKSYNDAPASPWSRLRDRSRDPANNAVKEKLPARYRDIVEKYYEAANGNSGSSE